MDYTTDSKKFKHATYNNFFIKLKRLYIIHILRDMYIQCDLSYIVSFIFGNSFFHSIDIASSIIL